MQNYLKEIANIPKIPREKEIELIKLAQGGDKKARNKIIIAYLKFVVFLAKKYHCCKMPIEDIVAYGNFGLIDAIKKFNIKSKHRFSTYATWWIRQKMSRSLQDHGRTIRIPCYLMERINIYKRLVLRNFPDKKIARKMKINLSDIKIIKENLHGISSLNHKVKTDDNDGSETLYFISSTKDKDYLDEDVEEILKIIPKRERNLIVLKYGLLGNNPHTLQEIANKINISRERVRQLIQEGLDILRKLQKGRCLYDRI